MPWFLFSLWSRISMLLERMVHSHPFPNRGWLVQMSLSIKKDVYTMWPLIEGNSCYDVLMLSNFFALRPIFTQIFAMPFGSRPLPINPGFLVLLSTKPRWPGGFGLPRHAHLAAVGQCGLRLRSGCAERAILAPKIPGSTGWHGGLLRPGRKGIWGVFSPKLFFPVCFFVNANTAGVLKHRKWWGNHGQFEIIVVCWNG